jgi:hypothetical protein
MIDLDKLEEMVGTFAPDGWVRQYVPPVVAELHAAREVIEATRGWLRDGEAAGSTDVIRAVTTAVIAYDKVTGEASR